MGSVTHDCQHPK